MKVVILAGGYGTRISEESHLRPKPMIEIGGQPILWHIMKYFSHYGYNEFIICAGYKQSVIKEYFAHYYLHCSDVTFDFSREDSITTLNNHTDPWKVSIVDTGMDTMTGGRIKRIQKYIGKETFLLTYGDGLSDVNVDELIDFHKNSGAIVTLTAVQPTGRFGSLKINDENNVMQFAEKRKEDAGWINGGFMVVKPEVFSYIKDDTTVFEKEPLELLSEEGNLNAYRHTGFWQCMDTLRDKQSLENLIQTKNAPWIKWKK
jgi:glucose-1-phosphate cytidylyltransferase